MIRVSMSWNLSDYSPCKGDHEDFIRLGVVWTGFGERDRVETMFRRFKR